MNPTTISVMRGAKEATMQPTACSQDRSHCPMSSNSHHSTSMPDWCMPWMIVTTCGPASASRCGCSISSRQAHIEPRAGHGNKPSAATKGDPISPLLQAHIRHGGHTEPHGVWGLQWSKDCFTGILGSQRAHLLWGVPPKCFTPCYEHVSIPHLHPPKGTCKPTSFERGHAMKIGEH